MTVRSMTAFAAAEAATQAGVLGCELRAVNHRFLDLGVRLPEELRVLESPLRERVAARLARGKLELTLRLRTSTATSLQLDAGLLEQLARLAAELAPRFPALGTDLASLLQYPGLVQARALDAERLQAEALALLDRVLDEFVAARSREGERLAAAISERARAIGQHVAAVRALMPEIRVQQRQRLQTRVAELATPLDPARFEQELVLALQRLDVDEELDRLDAHLAELARVIAHPEPAGRRLDFLMQEFNREANTLGSKSADLRTSQAAVELKVLIDQMREQAQNIE
jgi:uncharacterized protein (TIGR00255 family)